jgi:ubiquinone/menaquinone biosynthesis C-methylase UbiE
MIIVIRILLVIFCFLIGWLIGFRLFRKIVHFPAPAFMGPLFDSALRRKIHPPELVVKRSGIKEGMRVLEVGCGSGAITTYVARTVGLKGEVYALDIQQKMLQQLENKLSRSDNQDLKNVELLKSSAYGLPFDDNSLDLVYMVAVLPEIPDKQRALREVRRVLKINGSLAVTEFWIDPDYPLKSTTMTWGKRAGFVVEKKFGNFWSYTIRFKKL